MNRYKIFFGLSLIFIILIGFSCASSEKIIVPACTDPNAVFTPEILLSVAGLGNLISIDDPNKEVTINYRNNENGQLEYLDAQGNFTTSGEFIVISKVSDKTHGIQHLEIIAKVTKACQADSANLIHTKIELKPKENVPSKIAIGSEVPMEKAVTYNFDLNNVFDNLAPCNPPEIEISVILYTNNHCPGTVAPSGYFVKGKILLNFVNAN